MDGPASFFLREFKVCENTHKHFSNRLTLRILVISQMRLWAMYRQRKVLIGMTAIVGIALLAMGLVEGFGYSNVQGIE